MRTHLAALSVLGCFALGCAGSSDPAAGTTPSGAGQSASSTDQAVASIEMVGTSGAVDAALAYVASTDDLMAHSPIGRREILRRIATTKSASIQLDALEQAAAELALTLDVPVERLVWVEAPISVGVVEQSADTALIDVWTVSIIGAADAGPPQQVWRTVHLGLVRTSDAWLVDEASADAGPTPAANELSLQAGFEEFERVSQWTPVVEGVGL